jgi:tetratricopeptide (TPR) repeat protein
MSDSRPPLGPTGPDAPHTPALADALRAIEPRVHLLAASVLIDAGALSAAWEPINEAARADDDPELRADLGDQLLRLARGWQDRRQHDAAGGALRLAAQLVPEKGIPALARHVQREGFLEEAGALWAEAIRLDPGNADHHLHYGRLLEAQGRFQEAHAAYLRLLEELPSASNVLTIAPRLERLAAMLPPAPGSGIRIAMLGSANLDQLRHCVLVQAHRTGLRPEIHLSGADRYRGDICDPDSGLYRFAPDVLILAIHRSRLFPALEDAARLSAEQCCETIHSGLDELRRLLQAFRTYSSALVLLHNMVVPQYPARDQTLTDGEFRQSDIFHLINLKLARLVSGEFRGVHLVDEDAIQGQCGKAVATDPRLWLLARLPWSESMLMRLAREHLRLVLARRGQPRTCLVVDLDNSLWGGLVAEGGVEGLRLGMRAPGNAFLLFQHHLIGLWKRGVKLAICSRANPDDAIAVLETHPEMVLGLGHFAATRIGCASKPQGVREIAAELELTLENIVFWDDSALERARMRAELPQVLTPEVPADPALRRQALIDLGVFDGLEVRERGE